MKIFKLRYICLLILFIIFLPVNYSHAEKIKEFKIAGNERLAKETIVLFSELNIGDEVDQNIINLSFKKLFATNYFKNLKVNLNNGIVFIEVLENPIIQKIQINGVKNNSLLEELKKITKQSEKYPFIETNILDLQDKISLKTGMSVNINNSKSNRGVISFKYKSLDQLERLVKIIKSNF